MTVYRLLEYKAELFNVSSTVWPLVYTTFQEVPLNPVADYYFLNRSYVKAKHR